jgi:hypothetical protein
MEINRKLFERLNGAIFLLVPWYLHTNNHETFGKLPHTPIVSIQLMTTKQTEGGSDKTPIVTLPLALPFQYIPKHKIIVKISIGEFPFEIHSPHPSLLDSQIYS